MFEKFIVDFEADFYNIIESNILEYKSIGSKFDSYEEWLAKQPSIRETSKNAFLHSQAYKENYLYQSVFPQGTAI